MRGCHRVDRYHEGLRMQLRSHPLMHPIWPPRWIWISGPDKAEHADGEVGTLENVQFSHVLKSTIFLTIVILDGNRYTGSLNFDDEQFAGKVLSIFRKHRGVSIKYIADLEV